MPSKIVVLAAALALLAASCGQAEQGHACGNVASGSKGNPAQLSALKPVSAGAGQSFAPDYGGAVLVSASDPGAEKLKATNGTGLSVSLTPRLQSPNHGDGQYTFHVTDLRADAASAVWTLARANLTARRRPASTSALATCSRGTLTSGGLSILAAVSPR